MITVDQTEIGVEITEAISEQYARYCALAEREFPDVFLQPGHFRWGMPELSVRQIRELLGQDQMTAKPWIGDRPERECALFMQSVIDSKLAKLTRPGYDLFDENWLAIYDNLPLPNIDLEKAVDYLLPLLEDRWQRMPGFNVVFIEHGPVIVQLTTKGAEHLCWRTYGEPPDASRGPRLLK